MKSPMEVRFMSRILLNAPGTLAGASDGRRMSSGLRSWADAGRRRLRDAEDVARCGLFGRGCRADDI